VGDSLTVELPTLTRAVLVRIQVPQPISAAPGAEPYRPLLVPAPDLNGKGSMTYKMIATAGMLLALAACDTSSRNISSRPTGGRPAGEPLAPTAGAPTGQGSSMSTGGGTPTPVQPGGAGGVGGGNQPGRAGGGR
jgi:hypothetical protein